MNEVALHRGRYPHLSVVDAFVNGQHLTEAVVRSPLAFSRASGREPRLTLSPSGGWIDPRDADGQYGLLPLLRWTYCASVNQFVLVDADRAEESEL